MSVERSLRKNNFESMIFKMAEQHVSSVTEQRVIIKFLVKEGTKPAEIFKRLSVQYGKDTVSKSTLYDWCKMFKEGREVVEDLPGRGGFRASL